MADIGSTLRDTRIRKKIDIGTVEAATKIRAKYLRALENEEWAVLPGPTYVKSFLRTYAEYLGLDAPMLVEEYSARFEPAAELELPVFGGEEGRRRRPRPRFPGPPSRGLVVGAVAAAVLALLLVLGLTGDESRDAGSGPTRSENARPKPRAERGGTSAARRQGKSRRARGDGARDRSAGGVVVSVIAVRDVWVCLVDARDRSRIGGRVVPGGEREGPFRSKRFRITAGNGGADLRINGRLRDVPESSEPLGYSISAGRVRTLSQGERPTCEGVGG